MGVVFKTLKYKHKQQALAILAAIEAGTATDDDADQFVLSLVDEWDYEDAETGEPVPAGDIGELSIEQYNDLMAQFNSQMEATSTVPKQSASPSRSGSTRSKAKKSGSRTRRSG